MWQTKTFKTKKLRDDWVRRNSHKYQWHDIFINNGYGVEYKKWKI